MVNNPCGSATNSLASLTILQPQPVSLADYYYPVYVGNEWFYDSQRGSSSWTTRVRVEAATLPLTFYTGCNPVSAYQRSANAFLYDQGNGSWTNYMSTGSSFGYLGTHHDGGDPPIQPLGKHDHPARHFAF